MISISKPAAVRDTKLFFFEFAAASKRCSKETDFSDDFVESAADWKQSVSDESGSAAFLRFEAAGY